MDEATQKREYAAEEVTSLNGELASLEALRKQLTLELDDLAKAIKEIQDAQAEAIKLRGEEKTEHEAIVKEAQEGLDALNMVIDILDKFYKTAAKAEVALVQNKPDEDVPDAGFDNSEAYTGAQGDAGGVMGMLEVMKSDFTRTVTETEAAEKQAEQDHLEFMTQSGMSLAEKEAAQKEKTRQLTDANSKFDEGKENLDAEMKKMKTAISELMELRPTCIDTGMSYEDRVARREEELAALQKALCILGAYQTYGPDGLAGQCDNA
uniref:Uncharacterized protein n=1 Tax=Spumella elongata TaxID=89044 RepID=A0A7S3HS90_9STRA